MSKSAEGLTPSGVVQEMIEQAGVLRISIVSPAAALFEGTADFIAAPGQEGELGVFSKHAELVTALGIGILRLKEGKDVTERFAVRKGFLEVSGDEVTVLVGDAARAEDVDEAAVQAELKETVAALAHPGSDEDFQDLLDQRAWCEARLKLLREPPLPFARK